MISQEQFNELTVVNPILRHAGNTVGIFLDPQPTGGMVSGHFREDIKEI